MVIAGGIEGVTFPPLNLGRRRSLMNNNPIPVHTCRCEYNCCKRLYVPLTLAYGKTAHTAQGITVGPTAPGRPPNLHQMAVINPGTKAFEGKCVGMFYTLVGRETTIGTVV